MSQPDQRQGLYASPGLYDILYTPGTAAEVTTFQKLEAQFGGPVAEPSLWLEPACGTGRYLAVAQRRGKRVAGFDRYQGMITYAKNRLTKQATSQYPPLVFTAEMANFQNEAEAQGLAAGSVNLAINPVNSLRHLATDQDMLAHFDDIASLLHPKGIYIVGISLTDYSWLMPEEDLWEGARGPCKVSQLVNYLPPEPGTPQARLEKVISHLTVTRPRGCEHFDDTYDLRTYDHQQWQTLVAQSALEVAGSFDSAGQDLQGRTLPYQLEVLRKKGVTAD